MYMLQFPNSLGWISKQHVFFDDFHWYISPHLWTSTLTDSGTATVGDVACGVLALVASDGSVADNDEAYVKTTNEVFLFADGKPISVECRLQFTEANTDDANVFFGLLDAIGANTLVDDGAGMKTSFSGAAIYKVDGGTVWKCVSSNSTTQTVSTSTKGAGGSSYQRLRIDGSVVDGTNVEITFFVDDVPLLDSTTRRPIKHYVALASATQMQVGAGVKNGSANNETLNIDYIHAMQLR